MSKPTIINGRPIKPDKWSNTPNPDPTLDRIEQAKKLMDWSAMELVDDGRREPTLLEYLRHYKSGAIKEIHMEAVIESHLNRAVVEAGTNELEIASFKNDLKKRGITPSSPEWKGLIRTFQRHLNKAVVAELEFAYKMATPEQRQALKDLYAVRGVNKGLSFTPQSNTSEEK